MAIKVKHDVNAAPMAVASAAAGKARRQMETAKLMAGSGRTTGGGGTGGGGGAHPIAPPQAHAQLLSAHAPTPVNWELQRRENAAQEAARLDQALKVAGANNDAAMERLKTQNDAAKEREQMGIDSRQKIAQSGEQAAMERVKATSDAAMERLKQEQDWRKAQEEQKLFDARAASNGYSPTAQKEVDRINAEYEKAVMDKRFTKEQLAELKKQRDADIAAIPTTRRKTPEELFNERMVFGGGDSGLPEGAVFDPQTGRLVVDPFAQQKTQSDAEYRRQQAEEQRAYRKEEQQMRRDAEVARRKDAAYLQILKQGKSEGGMNVPYDLSKPEDIAMIERQMNMMFPPAASVQPGSAGAQPVPAATTQPAATPTAQPIGEPAAAPTVPPPPANATPEQKVDYAKKRWAVRK